MGKHQQECDYLAIIAKQAEEITTLEACLRTESGLRAQQEQYTDELLDEIAALKVDRDAGNVGLHHLKGHNDALRAEMDALKSQKPIGYWRHTFAGKLCINKSLQCNIDGNSPELPDSTPLYARPVPAIPEGYALVPIEPTWPMMDAPEIEVDAPCCGCSSTTLGPMDCKRVYKAMIAAAQEKL